MSTDCENYETYTLKIDTKFSPSHNSFIAYTNAPLRNIVKVELLSASVSANVASSNVIYVYAMELDSKFLDRAQIQTAVTSWSNTTPYSNVGPNLTGTFSNVNQLRSSLVCYPADQLNLRSVFTTGGYWPAYVDYIEPVRQIQQLTISLYGETGALLTVGGPTFLTLKFTCAKPNKCFY
jgi:hypothetical protein